MPFVHEEDERLSVAGEPHAAAEDGARAVIVEPGTLRHTLGRIRIRDFLLRPLGQIDRQRVHRAQRGQPAPAGDPHRIAADSFPVYPRFTSNDWAPKLKALFSMKS